MATRIDSEARKRRDAELRTQDDAIADHLAQALKTGELQSAESFGKPMADAAGWRETPVEFRLPFKILRNAGIVPPEVEMFQRRARLRVALEAATEAAQRERLQRALSDLEQALALRLEGMRARGRL